MVIVKIHILSLYSQQYSVLVTWFLVHYFKLLNFIIIIVFNPLINRPLIHSFAGQFTEDGSFIGQYVPGKLQPPVSPLPIAHSSQGGGGAGATSAAAPSPTSVPGMHSNGAATYV